MFGIMARIENLILTVWVGGLISIGYVAVPVLFKTLEDRSMAGDIAGTMFTVVSVIGAVCGFILLLSMWRHLGKNKFKHWRFWTVIIMLILVLIGAVVLQPIMANIKQDGLVEGSEAVAQFAKLHGISAILYLATVILGSILVMAGSRSKKTIKTMSDIHKL